VIRDAKEKDHQGSYQCQVTNDFGHAISGDLNIKIGELYIHHWYLRYHLLYLHFSLLLAKIKLLCPSFTPTSNRSDFECPVVLCVRGFSNVLV